MSDAAQDLEGLKFQNQVLLELALAQRRPATSLEEAVRPITEASCAYLGVERAGVWLFTEDGQELRCLDLFNREYRTHSAGEALAASTFPKYFEACRTERCIAVEDGLQDDRVAEFVRPYFLPNDISSTLDMPLFVADQPRGVVKIEQVGPRRAWSESDERFSGSIADLVALAIAAHEREEESRLIEALLATASQSVLVVAEDGRIQSLNATAEKTFGYKAHELIGQTVELLVPRAIEEQHVGLRQSYFEAPFQRPLGTGGYLKARHRDGHEFPVKVALSHVTRRGKLHALAMLTDVSEWVEKDRILRESEALYRAVVDDQHDFITRAKVGGQLTFANRRACEVFGVKLEDVGNYTIYDFVPEEDRPLIQEHAATLTPEKPTSHYEHRTIDPNGRLITIAVTLRGLFDDSGALEGYQSIARDVSDSKIQEARMREAQRMETLAIFASGIAHDFNNLLMPIIGFSDLMARHPEASERYLEPIRRCARRAAELVAQILSFSRRDEEQARHPLPAAPLIRETMQIVRASVPSSIGVHLSIDSDCGVVTANPSDIYQIVSNLCTNAYQAMPAGGSLEVSAHLVEEGPAGTAGQRLQVVVRDTGSGMPAELRERIFEPFFSTKHASEGTGLGLSVVAELVGELGGSVDVQSEPGRGSSFVVLLPCTAEPAIPSQQVPVWGGDLTGTERILVVDDEPMIVAFLREGLERLGYQVTARTSANEALAAFHSNPDSFDAILVDFTMPHMNGAELARRFREKRPGVPIVMCTGFGGLVTQSALPPSSVDRVLHKPLDLVAVVSTLRQVLQERGE